MFKLFILHYTHDVPATCFGHTCGHPQGGVYKGCVTKTLRPSNMNTAHVTPVILTTV